MAWGELLDSVLGNYGDLGLSFLTERFLKFPSKKPLIALNDRERNMSSKRYQFVLSSKKDSYP